MRKEAGDLERGRDARAPSGGVRPAAGVVLAAGRSRRMGRAKALLDAGGEPLAVRQVRRLLEAGCAEAGVVLGAGREAIEAALGGAVRTIANERWEEGRAGSLQAGAAAFPEACGWLFLPVDAAGVQVETLAALLAAARWESDRPWRANWQGRKGTVLWLPRSWGARLAALPKDARVDEWVAGEAMVLEVADAGVVSNFNTPEEWEAFGRDRNDTKA